MPLFLRRFFTSPALLLAASVIVPVLFCTFAIWRDHASVVRAAEQDAQQNAIFLNGHADEAFEALDLILAQVNERLSGIAPGDIGRSLDLHQLLATLQREHKQIDSIVVTDVNGRIQATSGTLSDTDADLSGTDYFQTLRGADGGLAIGAPFAPHDPASVEFSVSRRRSSPDGQFIGIVTVGVFPEYFEKFYETVRNSPHDAIALFRRDGTLLARYPQSSLLIPPLPSASALFQIMHAHERGVINSRSVIDGIDRIVAFSRSSDYPIIVTYGIDRRAVLSAWQATLTPYLAFAALATFSLIGLSVLTLDRARRAAASARRLDQELQRRRELQAVLVETEKMKSVGQMTGGIAHDFNNLLTVISGNLEMIELAPDKPERVVRLAAMARKAADRGERLIQQLLMFSRRQVLRPETINPNRLLADFEGLMRRALGDGVTLKMKLSPAIDLVRLDPAQFEAAILNLIVNARDAVGSGGTVTLETTRLFLSPGEAAPLPAADYVRISVTDDGEGIPEDVLPRVFEPFFTTKDPGKGSGLGLSQIYGFAQEFGGQVKIDSVPGRGTTVSLYLPRARSMDAVEPDHTDAPPHDAAPLTGQSILVVDDDREVLDVAVENLSDLGYRVRAAHDGSEALQMLRGPEPIDLLLTDVVMPGAVNGEQLAREARILRPGLKILLTSGYPSAVLADRADVSGHFEILGKPYRRDDLATTLRRVLGGVQG